MFQDKEMLGTTQKANAKLYAGWKKHVAGDETRSRQAVTSSVCTRDTCQLVNGKLSMLY